MVAEYRDALSARGAKNAEILPRKSHTPGSEGRITCIAENVHTELLFKSPGTACMDTSMTNFHNSRRLTTIAGSEEHGQAVCMYRLNWMGEGGDGCVQDSANIITQVHMQELPIWENPANGIGEEGWGPAQGRDAWTPSTLHRGSEA